MWAKPEVNRPTFYSNEDIQGSAPRQLHFALNKEEYQLRNDDIEGTRPDCFKFKSTREPSNPLNPQYKLASFTVVPPPVPKFVRDSISNADIEGSKTKPPKTKPERVSMVVRDI